MEMNEFIKLSSLEFWVNTIEKKVYSCDAYGEPNYNDARNIAELKDEWFTYLSQDDKQLISTIIDNK